MWTQRPFPAVLQIKRKANGQQGNENGKLRGNRKLPDNNNNGKQQHSLNWEGSRNSVQIIVKCE